MPGWSRISSLETWIPSERRERGKSRSVESCWSAIRAGRTRWTAIWPSWPSATVGRVRWIFSALPEAGSRTVAGDPGDSVSVFPFTGPATGVTLEGFNYPLQDTRLEMGDTLGFHNELTGAAGRISVEGGVLLVIHEAKENP